MGTQHCSHEVAGDQFCFKAISNICLVLSNKGVLQTSKIELLDHENFENFNNAFVEFSFNRHIDIFFSIKQSSSCKRNTLNGK